MMVFHSFLKIDIRCKSESKSESSSEGVDRQFTTESLFCRSHLNFQKVTRTGKKNVTTTPLVIMGLSNACFLMLHQQNEYRVLYQDNDGS
jgi:hypothetical protein